MKINFNSKKWISVAVVILMISMASVVLFKKPPQEQYDIYNVTRGSIRNQVLSTGTVQPENKLEIKPPINGRADRVLVNIGDKVKQGQVLAWMSSTDRAVLLDAARTKGPETLKYWEEMYKPAALVAPLDGTIISKAIVPGQVMTSSDVVFTMSDYLIVAANLDETDLSKIFLQQDVELVLDAYPNEKFVGKVERIAYSSTTTNNVTTYEVDILPNKTPEFMRSGMTANATFIVAMQDDTVVIPSSFIRQKDGKSQVLMTDPERRGKVLNREIQTGLVDGRWTEVVSGLKEGEIILSPRFKLTAVEKQSNPLIPSPPRKTGSRSSMPPPP